MAGSLLDKTFMSEADYHISFTYKVYESCISYIITC